MSEDVANLELPFYVSELRSCPYLAQLQERKLLTPLEGALARPLYAALLRQGFRRSHGYAYRPMCPTCSACISVRIPVLAFAPSRSQQRVIARNRDVTTSLAPADASDEAWDLFRRYIAARHGDGEMAEMTEDDFRAFALDSPVDSAQLEMRDESGELLAVTLIDRLPDGPSAVYTFFEPAAGRRSLGTFAVLELVRLARDLRFGDYVYLGYWVDGSRTMSYKTRFAPLEGYVDDRWQRLTDARANPRRVSRPAPPPRPGPRRG